MADLENRELRALKDDVVAAIAESNASLMAAVSENGAEMRKEIAASNASLMAAASESGAEMRKEIAASNASLMAAASESGAEMRKEIAGLRNAIETMAEMLLPPSQVASVRRAANG
ncbi:MAG TPA: hypothetical protein VGG20_29840 [Thermoanaerobaculia bacterium]|jgi:hypothetical protein